MSTVGAVPPLMSSDAMVSGVLSSSGLNEFLGPAIFTGPVTIISTTPVSIIDSVVVTGTVTAGAIVASSSSVASLIVTGTATIGALRVTGPSNVVSLTSTGTVTASTITDGTFSSTGGVVTSATILGTSNNVAANSLKTTGAVVNVAASAPPASTYVLIATSATTATWQPQSAITGAGAALAFAEYVQAVQGTNSSVAVGSGNSLLVDTDVYTNASIVKGSNGTIGTVWTLAAGTYMISFGANLSSTGPIGIYKGPSLGSLVYDANTMVGSTVSTTWVAGQAVLTVAAGTIVSIGASVSTAVVAVSGTGAPNYTVRVTFLKIA